MVLSNFVEVSTKLTAVGNVEYVPRAGKLVPQLDVEARLGSVCPRVAHSVPSNETLLNKLLKTDTFTNYAMTFNGNNKVVNFILTNLVLIDLRNSKLFRGLFTVTLTLLNFFVATVNKLSDLNELDKVFDCSFSVSCLLCRRVHIIVP